MGLLNTEAPVGLAISGGKDSVCCAYLLNANAIPFVLVHCNFKLRGEESDGDETFVSILADRLEHCQALYSTSFDTAHLKENSKHSIQSLARELRYEYFDVLHREKKFSFLLTAHHANDQAETFFINLSRGSGIKGLSGIPVKRDYIVRPMMVFDRGSIDYYLQRKGIAYRSDSSNQNSKYKRNALRNQVLPLLHDQIPGLESGVQRSTALLRKQSDLLDALMKEKSSQVVRKEGDSSAFSILFEDVLSYPHPAVFLYYILNTYGFNTSQCEDIADALHRDNSSGNQHFTTTHCLRVGRDAFFIEALGKLPPIIRIPGEGVYSFGSKQLIIEAVDTYEASADKFIEYLQLPSTLFPLELRTWQQGDFIRPLGMAGKQLVSDFFTNHKFNPIEKESTPLLIKGNEVLWLIPHRISETCKVTGTSDIYKLRFK